MIRTIVSLFVALATLVACGDFANGASMGDGHASSSDAPEGTSVDVVEIVNGVADRGRTPSVVALLVGGDGVCSGTLIAPNAVLTARHCVARTKTEVECPAKGPHITSDRNPETLSVLVGESVSEGAWAASGAELFVPDANVLCDADIAIVVLDRVVPGVAPLAVRKKGVSLGERIRAVGFGKKGDLGGAGEKVLRDYVRVDEVTPQEFMVAEATCQGDSGGPAIDMTTGEVIGVVSRGGPSCEGADVHNIYTRVDAYANLIGSALAKARDKLKDTPKPDAGANSTLPAPKPAPDVGENCGAADECAAGICVHEGAEAYCSRPCGSGLRCPTHFHCGKVSDKSVCLAVKE